LGDLFADEFLVALPEAVEALLTVLTLQAEARGAFVV
jgi:hypothetical protein